MFRILRYALGLAHTVIESATMEDDRVVVDVRPHRRHGLRCPVCGGMCADNLPPFAEVSPGHFALCHLAADEAGKAAECGDRNAAEYNAEKAAEGDRREAEV